MNLLPDAVLRGLPSGLDAALLRCQRREDLADVIVRYVASVAGAEGARDAVGAIYARYCWLRGGRRIYVLDHATIDALLDAPLAPTIPRIDHAICVQWTPGHPRLFWRHKQTPMPYAGVWLLPPRSPAWVFPNGAPPPEIGTYLPCGWHQGRAAIASQDYEIKHPGSLDHDEMDVLIWTLLAALADVRVSTVVTFPRVSSAARRAAQASMYLRKLQLTPDARGVWATQRIGPPMPDPAPAEGRKPVGEHHVAEHTARFWISRRTHPDVEPELVDGAPLVRQGKAGPLVAVRLPVRSHVRGKGDCAAKVTRVVAP